MSFIKDVGGFFINLGTGITENIQSQAAFTEAQAAAITAIAASTETRLILEAEEKKRKHQLLMLIIIIAASIPLLSFAIYYGLKK